MISGCAQQAISPSKHKLPVTSNEISLSQIYKLPVGPMGLEPTDKLKAAAGKIVKVSGYLVNEEDPVAGTVMLTPMPVTLTEVEDGPADFLPPATLFVHLPKSIVQKIIPFQPGLWTAVGKLTMGGQQEVNGRVSYVQLQLADPADILTPAGTAPELQEATSKPHHH